MLQGAKNSSDRQGETSYPKFCLQGYKKNAFNFDTDLKGYSTGGDIRRFSTTQSKHIFTTDFKNIKCTITFMNTMNIEEG